MEAMGVFRVPIKLRNWQNDSLPPDQRGEDIECQAIVDSGATELALPADVVERLRLVPLRTRRVKTADGRVHEYRLMGIVELEVQGRVCEVAAIELPLGAEPLLGAVPLEVMDWHISPNEHRLLPDPRSPDEPVARI
jgi:clan AA aspartic protease